MSTTFVMGTTYVAISCGHESGGCNLPFAVTLDFYNLTKRTGQTWYCPNGHPRVWGGATTESQLEDAKARNVALQDQLSAAIRDADQTRAALLRDRARFAAGVCPCCTRSFENVRRHMATQHPDYDLTRVAQHRPKFACSCGSEFESFRGLRTHQGHMRATGGSYAWDKPNQDTWFAHLTKV